jgi:putative ABC transport system substrate-binding protein
MLTLPSTARAQKRADGKKVGYVYIGSQALVAARVEIILAGLRASGQAMAKDDIVLRVIDGHVDKLGPAIKEVLDQKVGVFIAGGPAALRLSQQLTRTVPILAYDFETDPVAEKYAESVARPGGNVSGVFLDLPNFAGKWIELLRECMPGLARVGLIWDPGTGHQQADTLTRAAGLFGIKTELLEVHGPADYAPAFATARDHGAQAVVLLSSPLVFVQVKTLGELAARERMPAITMFGEFGKAGGMLAYGPRLLDALKQASFMAGKVLGGTPIGNLPIERPATYELVVNQRSAEALGVKLPVSIQARADEVVE